MSIAVAAMSLFMMISFVQKCTPSFSAAARGGGSGPKRVSVFHINA